MDAYPIPKIRDLFAKVAGAKKISILDLSQAYQQVQLDGQSRKYVVINTQRAVPIQLPALWYCICTGNLLAGDGEFTERHPRSCGVHR